MSEKYKIVRNDGVIYMVCEWDTALRLMRQLNDKYDGIYQYRVERVA